MVTHKRHCASLQARRSFQVGFREDALLGIQRASLKGPERGRKGLPDRPTLTDS